MKNKKLQRKTELICVAKIRTLCAVNVDINPVSRNSSRSARKSTAVGLAPSLLPRPGAVAITVTTTALAGALCG